MTDYTYVTPEEDDAYFLFEEEDGFFNLDSFGDNDI